MRGLTVAVLLIAACVAGPAHGQSVTRATFKVVTAVQEMMEQGRHAEALTQLEALVEATREIPYDHAIANQYLAHNSVVLDQPQRARSALEVALAQPELPEVLRTDMMLFYGTVLLGEEEFELAREVLDEWLAIAPEPTSSNVFSVAYANYQSGRVAESEPLVARAISMSSKPRVNWHQFYYRVLFELKKYRAAAELLKTMLGRDPSNAHHWRMLASHYLQLEQSEQALAVIMVAYTSGLIEKEEDRNQIVSLYGYIDIPDKGARLLSEWLDEQKLPTTPEVLKQLGNLWLMARESGYAKDVLARAAELAPDGRTYELLGGIYFEDEDWEAAYSAYLQAMRAGGIEEPDRLQFLAGISAMRAGQTDDARAALREAAKSNEFRSQARSLLKELDEA